MAKIHKIENKNGEKADVGTTKFTMQQPTIEGLKSWVNLPCWLCGEPIKEGEDYYIASVPRNITSDSAIVHASLADKPIDNMEG